MPIKNATNLVACVRAIRESGESCDIVVVDDGVADWSGIAQWTKCGERPSLRVIQGVKPFVFARNINKGIRAAGTDDVIVLNDDALLNTPAGFTHMARQSTIFSDYGMLAASCDNVGNPNQFRRAVDGVRPEPRMVCFVCVYIPRSTIDLVGLLDERFVGYGLDDDDYSMRVRNAGLKLGVYDGCYVDHGSLTSSYRGGAKNGGDFRPNLRLFIEKWGVDNWGKTREQSEWAHLWPEVKA